VPVDLFIRVDTYRSPHFQAGFRCLFGLVEKDIYPSREKKSRRDKTKAKRKRSFDSIVKALYATVKIKGLLPELFRFVRSAINHIRIKELEADFKAGLEDPADTGILCALVMPLSCYIRERYRHNLVISPVFNGDMVLEGSGHGIIRVIPLRLVILSLCLLFSMPVIRALAVWLKK
jgi:hypothetical protein